jgi:hypothetical protein
VFVFNRFNCGNDFHPYPSLLSKTLKINKTEAVMNISCHTGLKLGLSHYRRKVDLEGLRKFAEEANGPSNRDIKGWKNSTMKSFIR